MHRSPTEEFGTGPGMSPLTRAVERASAEIIAARTLSHDRLQKPYVSGQRIDEVRGVGAFVLAEHIDYDGGWCGNQFRYSVWLIRAGSEPSVLYSDHSYHRPELRGTVSQAGRDPRVEIVEICDEGVVIRATGRSGEALGGCRKMLIGFDGTERELVSFADQARNHIEQIGAKLGYDHLSAFLEIPGEDIAAVTYTSENGRDYGYETIYLVWRDNAGELQSRRLHRGQDYTSIRRCALVEGGVEVVVVGAKEETFKIPATELSR